MPDNIGKTLIRRTREWGVTDVRIEQGGKHPRLIGDYSKRRLDSTSLSA